LLRIVAIKHDAEQYSLMPDPARRRPGRGAHLHPDPACLALAERRRAFGRALRIAGVVDAGPVVAAVNAAQKFTASEPPMVVATERHPDQQGRTTDMSTR
jgi:predicted RNA-binding protein YlxR (DUF448 family)